MSHRCSLCDFSPTVPSIYNEGLTHVGPHRNHLIRDYNGEYICSECLNSIDAPTPILDEELLEIDADDNLQEFSGFTQE